MLSDPRQPKRNVRTANQQPNTVRAAGIPVKELLLLLALFSPNLSPQRDGDVNIWVRFRQESLPQQEVRIVPIQRLGRGKKMQ